MCSATGSHDPQSHTSNSNTRFDLLVFGPQASIPPHEYLLELRASLLDDPHASPFVEAIKGLPDLWRHLLHHNKDLSNLDDGLAVFEQLATWIDLGTSITNISSLTNSSSMTLTVIIHMAQYFHLLKHYKEHSQVLKDAKAGGVQGFCLGLLSAIAVSCSSDETELASYAVVALRLAACIGVYVDHRQLSSPMNSLVVRWTNDDGHSALLQALQHFPKAYISVLLGSNSVTVTTEQMDIPSLTEELISRGISVLLTPRLGAVHSRENEEILANLIKLSHTESDLKLPKATKMNLLVRSNKDAQNFSGLDLTHDVLKCILVDSAVWHLVMTAASSDILEVSSPNVLSFGYGASGHLSLARNGGIQLYRAGKHKPFFDDLSPTTTGTATPNSQLDEELGGSRDAIAVIGMGCKFPEADGLEEFWRLLVSGASALAKMPAERFDTNDLRRTSDKDLQFWGNFVRDIEAFDHKFFKKSSREAASTDPQQRLLLQIAYEALESSGYFGNFTDSPRDIGCYIGVCSSDYNDNVASHDPNAYSSLGTLRAFLSGKISHYFGWTGPSLTVDTACSSSAVAIHTACKSLISGECSQAIAGGVSLFTNPLFYQNLAAASFLSPTGATKPFDAKADGYCRGEGIGLVVLKKLSTAIADHDHIFGVIRSTAVNQNHNCTSITVPHSGSQEELFSQVCARASMSPMDISYIQAHGTGTPVGDPIEMDSIRKVFGGNARTNILNVASVKGNIGHLEGASGVAALIQIMLMMQYNIIPIQANFATLNPKILPLEPSNIAIPSKSSPWKTGFYAACINNYGAAGSNAAMIVTQKPPLPLKMDATPPKLIRYPIFISASTKEALNRYCKTLLECKHIFASESSESEVLGSLAFNLSNKQNRSLLCFMSTAVESLGDLRTQLQNSTSMMKQLLAQAKPFILVFGGQSANLAHVSKTLYDTSAVVRHHLDLCDATLRSVHQISLYPGIFKDEAVENTVQLHAQLFALQYVAGKSWLDCGVHPSAMIGHSFGQLTALCLSGALSLEDTLRFIVGRAQLISQRWGDDRGSMLHIEADLETVKTLLLQNNKKDCHIDIACHNGPTSYVLAGTTKSIDILQTELQADRRQLKYKRLDVTHAYHSSLTEPLLSELTRLTASLSFNDPVYPLELCSSEITHKSMLPQLLAEHVRAPVYFTQAVSRLKSRLGPCTWLEAGSRSPVISMAKNALSKETRLSDSFHPMDLSEKGWRSLVDVTTNLWSLGHKVHFWPFHKSQRASYAHMNLPSYQWEKSRHWLKWVDSHDAKARPVEEVVTTSIAERPLISPSPMTQADKDCTSFDINTQSPEWRLYLEGHAVLAQSLCSVPLYVELLFRASMQLSKRSMKDCRPVIHDLAISAPLGIACDRRVQLVLSSYNESSHSWLFEFTSVDVRDGEPSPSSSLCHATGKVELATQDSLGMRDFHRYERLVNNGHYEMLARDPDAEVMQGPMIYKLFSKVVNYAEYYKGVRSICTKGVDATATIKIPSSVLFTPYETMADPLVFDNFIQVVGLQLNVFGDCKESEVFVCTKIDRFHISSVYDLADMSTKAFNVFSSYQHIGNKEATGDIFVYDAGTKKLVCLVLGACFTRVLIKSLAKRLFSANNRDSVENVHAVAKMRGFPLQGTQDGSNHRMDKRNSITVTLSTGMQKPPPLPSTQKEYGGSEYANLRREIIQPINRSVLQELTQLLHASTEIPLLDLKAGLSFDDVGIDSLMAIEVLSEICKHFHISIPNEDFANLITIKMLAEYIEKMIKPVPVAAAVQSQSSDSEYGDMDDDNVAPSMSSSSSTEELGVLDSGTFGTLVDLLEQNLDSDTPWTKSTNLVDRGVDSLVAIQLMNDIKKTFHVDIDMSSLSEESNVQDLYDLVRLQMPSEEKRNYQIETPVAPPSSVTALKEDLATFPSAITSLGNSSKDNYLNVKHKSLERITIVSRLKYPPEQVFETIRFDYDSYAKKSGFEHFWRNVYPIQARLVLAYVVEAFTKLYCPLDNLQPGERLPNPKYLPQHELLVKQLHLILKDGGLITSSGSDWLRTKTRVNDMPSDVIFREIIDTIPQHAIEHRLLHITGSKLASCLDGSEDPLKLLFASKQNRALLEEVYAKGPMYEAVTQLLATFLQKSYSGASHRIRILEIGGGTAGTTKYVVNFLKHNDIDFEYTFTDISPSLVATAKRTFAGYTNMQFLTLDIEKTPPEEHLSRYDTVLSTNCVHATHNLETSLANIRKMLKNDGFLSLVEFTRNIYWFDLVFGLLGGWWLFNDGRKHVLADVSFWENAMRTSGFAHVSWTTGASEEARTLRIISAFNQPSRKEPRTSISTSFRPTSTVKTVIWKSIGQLDLFADIYLPQSIGSRKMPIALLIHGGGHCMFTRKEADRRQIEFMLEAGILPISIDYRFCPELNVIEGPMADVSDAVQWVRSVLPSLEIQERPHLIVDATRVVVVGWSTGGTLAMSTAFTTLPKNINPPDAILAFYCPTDYSSGWWKNPIYPSAAVSDPKEPYDLLEGVRDEVIANYYPETNKNVPNMLMSTKDPRWRFILHMNWRAQTLPLLINGLPTKSAASHAEGSTQWTEMSMPDDEIIASINPMEQIRRGHYRVPTYLVHGTADDMVPWEQSAKTILALKDQGVAAGFYALQGAEHLFDTFGTDHDGGGDRAIRSGYQWLFERAYGGTADFGMA